MERGMISLRQRDVHQDRRDNNKKWGIDLGPKPVLSEDIRRRIYETREKGLSFGRIAEILNKENIPTVKEDSKWHASTVRHVYLSYIKSLT